MLKVLYKIIILVSVFISSFFFFSKNIKEEKVSFNTTVEMADAKFPVLFLKLDNKKVNLQHGYSGNIDSNLIRDSITPLESDKNLSIFIDEKESIVNKIKYEVRDIIENKLIDSGTVSSLVKDEDGNKTAKIRIKANIDISKEYTVSIIAITDSAKKIYYYSRITAETDVRVKEALEFAIDFHDSIMDKKKAEDIIAYLEPDSSHDNSTLAHVNINSNFDLISWGNLNPSVISEVVPTIKEINGESSSIELKYTLSAQTQSGTESYTVKEYYRIRWTNSRMYLLDYDRTMESVFDTQLVSLAKSEFKIGISDPSNIQLVTNDDNSKLCFVREKALWYYNIVENNSINVFDFRQKNTDHLRDNYDQHNIRILNMDEGGNIDFIVYGYMNRGDYEGRVAIILYKFYAGENRIEEQVYIPVDVPYQLLKEELNSFSYVNQSGIFYFSINNTIYAYNIVTKGIKEIVSNVSSDSLAMPKNGGYIGWQDNINPKKSKNIHLLDLETGTEKIIPAPDGNNIIIVGTIDLNVVYGYCLTTDITKQKDGSYETPLYKIDIVGGSGSIIKSYEKKDCYVVGTTVDENVIELERVTKKVENKDVVFVKIESDYILNKVVNKKQPVSITSRITENSFTEDYLSLPSGVTIKEQPSMATTVNTIITKDTTLYLSNKRQDLDTFYVYGRGGIAASYSKTTDAVLHADEIFGVVVNKNQQVVWARGAKSIRSEIVISTPTYVDQNIDSVKACINMVLRYNKIVENTTDESKGSESIYDTLEASLGNKTINLSGCTLDEVLYFISQKRPVIAMKDKKDAVLITAYDEFNITVIDPSTKKLTKIGLKDSAKMFEEAGNIFISFIN